MLTTCLGAHYCLPDLGVRIPGPSGSIGLIRGRELRHFTTPWTGPSRYCVVHCTHESVRMKANERIAKAAALAAAKAIAPPAKPWSPPQKARKRLEDDQGDQSSPGPSARKRIRRH